MAKNKKEENIVEQEIPDTLETETSNTSEIEEQVSKKEFDAKNAECEELRDRFMRTVAEYDNFRKRTARERETLYSDAANTTIAEFLSVYDNLERALETKTEDEAYFKGVEMIFAGLCETFNKLGVETINPINETFDPQLHNAVMHVDDEQLGENIVAEVFQKGFKRSDRVIRHAIVKVAN